MNNEISKNLKSTKYITDKNEVQISLLVHDEI